MFIAARLVLSALALLLRLVYRAWQPTPTGMVDGFPYYVRLTKSKKKVTSFRLGVPLRGPWFRVTTEERLDRFMKARGLAREVQTGDAAFDDRFYVESDHPALHELLRKSGEVRAMIQGAFDLGFVSITCNGACLWLERPAVFEPGPPEIAHARDLGVALAKLEHVPWYQRDRFFWRALLVEAVVWSLFAFAATGFLEYLADIQPHVYGVEIVLWGLAAGVLISLALALGIALLLRGSSRSHRIILESGIVLALAMPVTGMQVVSDLNRGLDTTAPVLVTRTVESTEKRRRLLSKRRRHSYYMHLVPTPQTGPIRVPDEIKVTESIYDSARPGDTASFLVGRGWMGLSWYHRWWVHPPPPRRETAGGP
jgi:hypothetical protein